MFDDDQYHLIDGQHRFHALGSLVRANRLPDFNIKVDIIMVKDLGEIREHFKNINLAVPVPQHCLTPSDIVNLCVSILQKKFVKAFSEPGKSSQRRPCINIDKFKDELIAREVIEKCMMPNGKALAMAIIDINAYFQSDGVKALQDRIGRRNKGERGIIKRCYDKCLTNDFMFIGIFKNFEWIDELFERYDVFDDE